MARYQVEVEVNGWITGKPCIPPRIMVYNLVAESVEDATEKGLDAAKDDSETPVGVYKVVLLDETEGG